MGWSCGLYTNISLFVTETQTFSKSLLLFDSKNSGRLISESHSMLKDYCIKIDETIIFYNQNIICNFIRVLWRGASRGTHE